VHARVLGQAAKQLRHFAVAGAGHGIGQLAKAQRGFLFQLDRMSEEDFDGIHVSLLSWVGT